MNYGCHERLWTRYPIRGPSRLGLGESFSYFDSEADIRDVVMCAHSFTMGRLASPLGSSPLRPRAPWSELLYLLWALLRGDSNRLWWPVSEALGLYLAIRSTSSSGLTLSTQWYADSTRTAMQVILKARSVERTVFMNQLRCGCKCMSCDIDWLSNGWVCPWAGL